MRQRILRLLIAPVLLAGLVACGDEDISGVDASSVDASSVVTTSTTTPGTPDGATPLAVTTVAAAPAPAAAAPAAVPAPVAAAPAPVTAAPAPVTAATTLAAPDTTAVPPPPPETTVVAPVPPVPRVLLVGDSTLLSVGEVGAQVALRGMDPVYEAASCRALGQKSCGDNPPTNSVRVIDAAMGVFDVVVIMAGYDEWYTTFSQSFDEVVAAARAKGVPRVVWLTYPEGVDYTLPDDRRASVSLINMNLILFERVASGGYPDVLVADWFRYSAATEGWFAGDDIHLSRTGAFAVADYISRKLAFAAGQPCPVPREVNGVAESPCPDPDVSGPVPDVVSLYADS